MARKPNYGYEKRQKELARQAKKAEKKQRKVEGVQEQESVPETEDE